MLEDTGYIYKSDLSDHKQVKKELEAICIDLVERGYDPVKQISEYLISGDPGYISSYKDCRIRIKKFDRTSLVEVMLYEFLK